MAEKRIRKSETARDFAWEARAIDQAARIRALLKIQAGLLELLEELAEALQAHLDGLSLLSPAKRQAQEALTRRARRVIAHCPQNQDDRRLT